MTLVRFDPAPGRSYAAGPAVIRDALALVFAEHRWMEAVLRSVRVSCSAHTAQEGRLVQRGESCEVRVNFCLAGGRSRILSGSRAWLRGTVACGGVPKPDEGVVEWSEAAARRYTVFLLFHELAHLVYMRKAGREHLEGSRSAPAEERFCDGWAERTLGRWEAGPKGA